MVTGSRCGHERGRIRLAAGRLELGIGAFVDERGGYTSVAMALSLLVCLSLVLSLASAAWMQNRAADVQAVSDSAALAGSNVVSSYVTVATALDASVLTMGLAGMVTLGAGLVLSAIPGLAPVGVETVKAGSEILDARRSFATSAAKGLEAVEKTLPLAIATRSASVAVANSSADATYVGCAIPFPQESETDFAGLESEVDGSEVVDVAEELQRQSERVEELKDESDAAELEGWLADCGNRPMSLRERAASLAGLGASENPGYPSVGSWTFGAPLLRSRAYYARRAAIEAPTGGGVDALVDSACRSAFYDFALAEVRAGRYVEHVDGTVEISLPSLPKNTDEMRATRLYTEPRWPCTDESGARTLHATLSCPGVSGASAGVASLADLEAGAAQECSTCRMGASDLGKVAAASTSIDNGFEHYWRRVVEASRSYERARNELAEAERELRETSDKGASAYERALEALAVPRPQLRPPGAWGCIAVVTRGGTESPESLAGAFVQTGSLPRGAAVSGSTLAPDDAAEGNDTITRLFEALEEDIGMGSAGILGSLGRLWGSLLVAYGSAAEGLGSAVDRLLSALEGVPGGSAASWLRDRLGEIVRVAGFEPADLRLRKPVLTNTQNVLDASGHEGVSTARELVGRLPASGDAASLARALGQQIVNELGGAEFTVAEIPIPGTDVKIPLTIDVGQLLGRVTS